MKHNGKQVQDRSRACQSGGTSGIGNGGEDGVTEEGRKDYIAQQVHALYYGQDLNCARTTLLCLSGLCQVPVGAEVMAAAVGLHGAGGLGAQCGLVEGGLMFLGLYAAYLGRTEAEAVAACRGYGWAFLQKFGSLTCAGLRPGGFSDQDPPHLCEELTCRAIWFTYQYVRAWAEGPQG